ncbi:cation diffusion facilitator family transporter [soil metagenome]
MQHPPDRSRHEVRAALLALLIGAALLAVKFLAYLLTDSAAIFSDALESIVNVLAAGLALYSVILANRPADAGHPYGHGKVEFVSAGFEGGMLMLAAMVIALRAIEQFWQGAQIGEAQIPTAVGLLAATMLVNGAMGIYLVRSGRAGGSITLEADGRHLLTDAVTSVGVVIALLLVRWTAWKPIDLIAALLIAGYVAITAISLLRRSAAGLMDEQDLEDDRLLRGILDSHAGAGGKDPRICSYHKLRHRHSGRFHWVDFHIMVPRGWDIDRAHQVASAIEYEIELALREGNATAHVEPCADAKCSICA